MINKSLISSQATWLRKQLGADDSAPIDIFSLAQTIRNLTLIMYPLGENVSGVCYKGEYSSVIVVNSDMSLGRQRFSLAHELYHLFFDDSVSSSVSVAMIGNGDEVEKAADQFASYFLIPQASLYGLIRRLKVGRDTLDLEDVVKLEQYYGVSHKSMILRLVEEGELKKSRTERLLPGVRATAMKLGYRISLYEPTPKDQNIQVLGYYITQVEKLHKLGKISDGKYDELLLSAFRSDIVYGTSDEVELID